MWDHIKLTKSNAFDGRFDGNYWGGVENTLKVTVMLRKSMKAKLVGQEQTEKLFLVLQRYFF